MVLILQLCDPINSFPTPWSKHQHGRHLFSFADDPPTSLNVISGGSMAAEFENTEPRSSCRHSASVHKQHCSALLPQLVEDKLDNNSLQLAEKPT